MWASALVLALALAQSDVRLKADATPAAESVATAARSVRLQADREILAAIRVQGNVATTDEEVRRLAGLAIGAPIGPETLNEVATRLRAAKRFDRVEVLKRFASITDPTQIVLVILVDEGPVRIEMTGDPNQPKQFWIKTRNK